LRGKLSQLGSVEVIARGSSMSYQHTAKTQQQIARELGARYLLTATVEWQPGAAGANGVNGARRLRVTPELVEVWSGRAPTTRWQQPFDATLTDVFQVQADIAQKVATALGVALGDSARRALAAKPTANLAAYDAFLKGEALFDAADPPTIRRAIGYYEQAVALDSAFLSAWARLAKSRSMLYGLSAPTPALAAAARVATDRARALGPSRPESYRALGGYESYVVGDNGQAFAAYDAGLRLAPHDAELLRGAGGAEEALGRWDAALQHSAEAARLDPRSAVAARSYTQVLLRMRRYPEAEAAFARLVALAPTNPITIMYGAMLALAQGDVGRAEARVRAGLAAGIDSTALFAFLANFQDLYWVLDHAQQQRTLALPPAAFDDDRAVWAIVRAELYQMQGDSTLMRAWADTARAALMGQLAATPDDGQRRAFLGLMLAYLGQKAEAIAEGERAVALVPVSRDAVLGPYVQHQLVRIHLALGEPEPALDRLEPLLKQPYYLSPGWLRVDPTFAPLRGNPRFERLAAGK
ncbi:MAG TPA: hypothetical protein VFW66_07450, partial [Gemmatimonadales bacterium]|nr:hypothetical protein [Gemmatimonadales bacterium]